MARVWSLIERAGADRGQCPDPRRERHRQGAGRARAAPPLAPRRPGAGLGRSRRGRRESVRKRAVRPCEGRLHRRPRRPHRPDAGGRQAARLFLDEIGNLPLHLQPKLLTALEQRQVVPVGANKPVPIDVRVIAATNCPPEQLADESRFRQDLLFRLNTVEIDLPPLARAARGHPRCWPTISSPSTPGNTASRRAPCPADVAARARRPMTGPATSARCATPAERAVILADGDAFTGADFSLSRGARAVARRAGAGAGRAAARRPQSRARRKADGRAGAEEAQLQHLARRRRARA